MKIYLIPGLGYDCRLFENLDFKNNQVKCLNWIEPNSGESINDYAARMCHSILDDKDDVIIIGHSLGGIVAQEVASLTRVKKVILISSIKSRSELPLHFKAIAPLKIYKFFTKELCINTVRFWGKYHGFENDQLQDLFKSMVGRHSNDYLKWALKSLSRWHPPKDLNHTSIFHIHGTKDRTLPFGLIRNPDIVIEKGSHILALKRFDEINELILDQIDENK